MCIINIRHSEIKDLPEIMEIYAYARKVMRDNGNPEQWKDSRPSLEAVKRDIERNCSYIIEADGKPAAVFSFIAGQDPTYLQIFEGHWINEDEYGTIHRIASAGTLKGVFNICLDFCLRIISNIRIDTHKDNSVMRRVCEQRGFKYCGIIYADDVLPEWRISFAFSIN